MNTKWDSFRIVPPDIPNNGILFVDHQKNGRSGHGGNTLTECLNGDIISFYSNVSGGEDNIKGHGVAGWSEYRRSKDGGKTWGNPLVLDYSKKIWDGDDVFSALVFCVLTAPNGNLIAILVRFKDAFWRKQLPPVYLLSRDNGVTWSGPREIDATATADDVSMTFDATFVHDNTIHVVFFGGSGGLGGGPYTLYVSTDNGETFSKRSTLPFDENTYYSTAAVLDNGDFIVYAYSYPGKAETDAQINKEREMMKFKDENDTRLRLYEFKEHNLPYVISHDKGRTWSAVRTAYFAKRLRNPQMSDKIGDYYFIHGRSGSHGDAPGNFVLYSSRDGIRWDEGVFLHKKIYPGGDKYSANEVIGKYNPSEPKKLLIQSSIVYDAGTSRVNEHHWWIDNISGTEIKQK